MLRRRLAVGRLLATVLRRIVTARRRILPWRRALRRRIVSLRWGTRRRLVVAALLLRRRVVATRRRVVALLGRGVMALLGRRILALRRRVLGVTVALRWRRLCDKSVRDMETMLWPVAGETHDRKAAGRSLGKTWLLLLELWRGRLRCWRWRWRPERLCDALTRQECKK